MSGAARLLICSDIHYASAAEKKRANYEINVASNALQRLLVKFYRHYFWLRDPFAHNELLRHVLNPPFEPDQVIANGDYSCDSAFIGVADEAAKQSAGECLGQLRARFPGKFHAVYGDHELGKVSLCGGQGGLRFRSLQVAREELGLKTVWTHRIGRYLLIGITSSLAALPVYLTEALESERGQWQEAARAHWDELRAAFESARGEDRILLFCHDPTALPFLAEVQAVRSRAGQIERTIIGHLHSELIFRQSKLLSGIPRITFCGAAVRRISSALSRAKSWKDFNVVLCPSLSGLEINRLGGYYAVDLDPDATRPARFELNVIRR
jgi:hypothetical protein